MKTSIKCLLVWLLLNHFYEPKHLIVTNKENCLNGAITSGSVSEFGGIRDFIIR